MNPLKVNWNGSDSFSPSRRAGRGFEHVCPDSLDTPFRLLYFGAIARGDMKMSRRFLVTAGRMAIVIASLSTAFTRVAGQTADGATWSPPKATYTPPRTPWGDPDLQGVWDYQSRVPMQRPAQLAGKATLTDAELAAWAKSSTQSADPV